LRKRAEELTGSSQQVDENVVANEAWRDLSRHVQSMDRDEAYRQMCLVQDEIQRLQQYCETNGSEAATESSSVVSRSGSLDGSDVALVSESEDSAKVGTEKASSIHALSKSDSGNDPQHPHRQSTKHQSSTQAHIMNGSWLDQGGYCSIEYLPNVKCYLLSLTSCDECKPKSTDELVLNFLPVQNHSGRRNSESISYIEIQLYNAVNKKILFSLMLPIDCALVEREKIAPSYNISIDNNSISIRMEFNSSDVSFDSAILTDELMGTESIFSSNTTDAKALNHLCCRSCHNPIVKSHNTTNQSVIRSVLPLPSGYWDEITDYLICYDGVSCTLQSYLLELVQKCPCIVLTSVSFYFQQPTVEFTSSSTSAIQGTALEDDVILILHRQDLLTEGGGICELNVKGYGEYCSADDDIDENEANSQRWKDKSLRSDADVRAVACAICCSTLGFVSSHDTDTFRFYKHLLSCNVSNAVRDNRNLFANHTCSSFLAREMIRYAESEAIYTFIVETDSRNAPSRWILLRMLSWDTLMATASHADAKSDEGAKAQFHKVLKVIFEETSSLDMTSDNPMDWQWGGIDLCCPPLQSKGIRLGVVDNDESDLDKMIFSASRQTKVTSVRICLSVGEWHELRHSLVHQSKYFSESVRDAVVMTKLGVMPGADQSALLSILPVT
jgi:hypothetical protein